jgi:hypothetical protein
VVPLLCNVHPEMSGYVIVSPTPYYAVADASGTFKIADVPDGSYTAHGLARRHEDPIQAGDCLRAKATSDFHAVQIAIPESGCHPC